MRNTHHASFTLLCSLIDPRPNQPDLFLRQRRNLVLIIRGRHVEVFIADMGDVMDEYALGTFARENDLPVLAAFERGFERIQAELALLLFGPMTFVARFFEDRFH